MLDLNIRGASAQLREQPEMEGIIAKLSSLGYRPAVRAAREAIADAAGLDVDEFSDLDLSTQRRLPRRPGAVIAGDVFFRDDHAFLLVPLGARLVAAELREAASTPQMDVFTSDVTSAAQASLDGRRLRGMHFDWTSAGLPGPLRRHSRSQVAQLTQQPAAYDEDEKQKALALVSQERRAALLAVAQVGKTRLADAREADISVTSDLIEFDLLRKEYLVTCRKDSHTLCTIPYLERLQDEAMTDIGCPVCGRRFRDELVQDIVALTDAGRKLLAGSRWMTIWVTHALTSEGIPLDDISWGAAAGEDEIDIAVTLLGRQLFLELKDREFGLGDAYPFVTRVARYGGELGVVVTTEKIGEEARKYFEEQGRSPGGPSIFSIELPGEEELRQTLRQILNEASASSCSRASKAWRTTAPLMLFRFSLLGSRLGRDGEG